MRLSTTPHAEAPASSRGFLFWQPSAVGPFSLLRLTKGQTSRMLKRGKSMMKQRNRPKTRGNSGVSFLELLVVIAILGILAALLIPYVSPLHEATSTQVARQQQAELQTALGSWVSAASAGPGGLAAARNAYNGAGSKLALLQDYLQPATYAALSGGGNTVSSAALSTAGASLVFSAWGVGGSPSVNWVGGQ